MALGGKRGAKRPAATETDDYSTPESADAALAHKLQLQEYEQNQENRRRASEGASGEDDSFSDEDTELTELDDDDIYEEVSERRRPRKKLRTSSRSNIRPMIPDSDDPMLDVSDNEAEDHSFQAGSESDSSPAGISSAPESEDQPLPVHNTPRNSSRRNQRLQSRGQMNATVSRALAAGMSYRVSCVK